MTYIKVESIRTIKLPAYVGLGSLSHFFSLGRGCMYTWPVPRLISLVLSPGDTYNSRSNGFQIYVKQNVFCNWYLPDRDQSWNVTGYTECVQVH